MTGWSRARLCWGRAGMSGLLGLTLLALTACMARSPSSPALFPPLGALPQAERGRILQSRTAGLQTLTAVVAVSYTLGKRQGTFDMVVNYAAPDRLRFTAFKDVLLGTQMLFDLLLAQGQYRLHVWEEAGVQTHRGAVSQFAQAAPTFRTFFVVGEAFFLPGFDATGQPPQFGSTTSRATTQLTSGARARWFLRSETLEITKACLRWETEQGTVPMRLDYQDYRPVAGYLLPHRVTLYDRRVRFTAHAALKQVDVNTPVSPDTFDLASTTP